MRRYIKSVHAWLLLIWNLGQRSVGDGAQRMRSHLRSSRHEVSSGLSGLSGLKATSGLSADGSCSLCSGVSPSHRDQGRAVSSPNSGNRSCIQVPWVEKIGILEVVGVSWVSRYAENIPSWIPEFSKPFLSDFITSLLPAPMLINLGAFSLPVATIHIHHLCLRLDANRAHQSASCFLSSPVPHIPEDFSVNL